jgi:hypothetical protein
MPVTEALAGLIQATTRISVVIEPGRLNRADIMISKQWWLVGKPTFRESIIADSIRQHIIQTE